MLHKILHMKSPGIHLREKKKVTKNVTKVKAHAKKIYLSKFFAVSQRNSRATLEKLHWLPLGELPPP